MDGQEKGPNCYGNGSRHRRMPGCAAEADDFESNMDEKHDCAQEQGQKSQNRLQAGF